jgi:hypothetical protein
MKSDARFVHGKSVGNNCLTSVATEKCCTEYIVQSAAMIIPAPLTAHANRAENSTRRTIIVRSMAGP